jgi:alpha-tubulin suppressor-like RCC1 family protein
VSGLKGVIAIAAGLNHNAALLSDGTVECWGDNTFAALGDGTSTGPETCANGNPCAMTPVPVSGLTGATAVTAGLGHACALLSGGTVECWGYNEYGELGDGMSKGPQTCVVGSCSTTPVAVSGLSGVTAIAAGYDHTCALLPGGTVACWGDSEQGELGDGAAGPGTCTAMQACSTTPVAVSGLSGVTAIAAGGKHTCALLSGGTVKCWGDNDYGELGDGTIDQSATPVAVSGLTGAIAIAAGAEQTCALLSDGTVVCWGDNSYGELGDGTWTGPQNCKYYPCSMTPAPVTGLTAVTAIAAGGLQTCALLSGGDVECWGANTQGQLGDDTSAGPQTCMNGLACSTTPVVVSGL